ncbi:hypothetical protein [Amnibacterium kyonggiense]|uniref:hypothetical protein n=1 Tax=Amnibacterium kyonggiense TaxID=595671 RepID=UPI0013C2E449|nr:hypothetical protein [Amnibacterium kyonggiense]
MQRNRSARDAAAARTIRRAVSVAGIAVACLLLAVERRDVRAAERLAAGRR